MPDDRLVILLGGGTKKRQERDIADANEAWREYKAQIKAAQKPADAKALTKLKPKTKLK